MTAKNVVTRENIGGGFSIDIPARKIHVAPSPADGNALAVADDSLLYTPGAYLALPVPEIVLMKPWQMPGYLNPGGIATSGSATDGALLRMHSFPVFRHRVLPPYLFDKSLDLRLELMWYRRANSRRNSGWHHPGHDDGRETFFKEPVAPNRDSTGDRCYASGSGVTSEWSIRPQQSDFTVGSLAQLFAPTQVQFRSRSGGGGEVRAYVPRYALRLSRGVGNSRRYGYSSVYRPNYFSWRFSVLGPDGLRINGPQSPTLVMGGRGMPFVQDTRGSVEEGMALVEANKSFVAEDFNCWFARKV